MADYYAYNNNTNNGYQPMNQNYNYPTDSLDQQQFAQQQQQQGQYPQQAPQKNVYYAQQGTTQVNVNVQPTTQYQNFDTQDPQAQGPRKSWYQAPDQLDYSKVGDLEFESRSGFVKKVYVLLTLELAATLAMTALAMNTSMGKILVYEDIVYYSEFDAVVSSIRFTGFYYFIIFAALFLQIALFCCSHLARKVPVNYILLVLYIFTYGMMIAGTCQFVSLYYKVYDNDDSIGQNMVWCAWLITFSLVITLTIYACTTKTDMTLKAGFIFVIFAPLFICIFLSIFFYSRALEIIICTLVIILYGFYLVWETQMIMGGKRIQLSIDDYIIGSLLLYGTIVQLFLRILEILMASRR